MAEEDRIRKYRKLSPIEHVKTRPGMYVGSKEAVSAEHWVADVSDEAIVVRRASVRMSPALRKLYDEVVTNAGDAAIKDKTVRSISIKAEVVDGQLCISVRNDGAGIPTAKHPEHGVPVPELIFGHLLSGTNFEDTDRTGAGQNGLGVKLCNIFSSSFTATVRDESTGIVWIGEWRDGMTLVSSVVKPAKANASKKGFVDVLFRPDKDLTDGATHADAVALFARRALDLALCVPPGVKVTFNDVDICNSSKKMKFKRYAELFLGPDVFIDESDGWSVAAAHAVEPFSVGIVNGVAAVGNHVTHASTKIFDAVAAAGAKKRSAGGVSLGAASLKAHTALLVVATVNAPTFSSQTKERCDGWSRAGTTLWKPSDKFVNNIVGSKIFSDALDAEKEKTRKKVAKATDGTRTRSVDVPKLRDATDAGTKDSKSCCLLVTEGDSALSFAVAGLGVWGNKRFGAWPLRGCPINPREEKIDKVAKNEEFCNLKKILGLKDGVDSVQGLRYGKVILLTDSDQDGSHIRGLVLNILHTFWPNIAKSGFVQVLPTPLVVATKGKSTFRFVCTADFDAWVTSNPGYTVSYYKGLGSWTSAGARDIFKNGKPVSFVDSPDADDAMNMAFSKLKVEERKRCIEQATAAPPAAIKYDATVPIGTFIKNEVIGSYSVYSVHRALPSVCDGMRICARKIVHTAERKNISSLARKMKVAQLAAATAAETMYLHGEQSLNDGVITLAQSFAGKNNCPLLAEDGFFGSRLQAGADKASPRYIHTYLTPFARAVLCKDDAAILSHRSEEGQRVEPVAFAPVLPLLLLNGAVAIATGFSCTVPSYNPGEVLRNVRAFLQGEAFALMAPWYRGFAGTVEAAGEGRWRVQGVFVRNGDEFTVTEVPVGRSFMKMAEDYKKNDKFELLADESTESVPRFRLRFSSAEALAAAEAKGMHDVLSLVDYVKTTNMYAFSPEGVVKKYASTSEILQDFCDWRLDMYARRKAHLLAVAREEATKLKNRVRFVKEVISETIRVFRVSKADLLKELVTRRYDAVDGNHSYLTETRAWEFTTDSVAALEASLAASLAKATALEATSPRALWEADLRLVEPLI